MLQWLSRHQKCSVHGCVPCALQAARDQLGSWKENALYAAVLSAGVDAAGMTPFLQWVLDSMAASEEPRPWPGVQAVQGGGATQMDVISSVVLEGRTMCMSCRHLRSQYEARRVLILPAPANREATHSFTDLYLEMCCPKSDILRPCRICGGEPQPHQVQIRVVQVPKVMFVAVPREAQGAALEYAFAVEDVISLPGCGKLELQAVVYDVGLRGGLRQHAAACRRSGKEFRFFEDRKAARSLGSDISELRQRSIVLVVYAASENSRKAASVIGQVLPVVAPGVAASMASGSGKSRPASETPADASKQTGLQAPARKVVVGEGQPGDTVQLSTRQVPVEATSVSAAGPASVARTSGFATAPATSGGAQAAAFSTSGDGTLKLLALDDRI